MGRMIFVPAKRTRLIALLVATAAVLAWPAGAVADLNGPPSHRAVLKKALLRGAQAAAAAKFRPLACDNPRVGDAVRAGPARRMQFFGSRPLVLRPTCGGTPYPPACQHRFADYTYAPNWGWSPGYSIRLHVYWCYNGASVTYCSRWPEVVYTERGWEFIQWLGWWPIGHAGGASCGAWVQAQLKYTNPAWYDDWHYPWIEAVGQRDGYWGANSGR
jgi:hypothetical protein